MNAQRRGGVAISLKFGSDTMNVLRWNGLALLVLLLSASAASADETAAAALEKLGARLVRENDQPKGAVIEVDLGPAPLTEVGLKARHVLCCVMARNQSLTVADTAISDDVHEATDIVDDGLALARRWEQKGVTQFRPIAFDLFRFGARVYAIFQPQFLTEFVRENLDPALSSTEYVESDEMQSAAREALSLSNRPPPG